MVKDDQENVQPSPSSTPPVGPRFRGRGLSFQLAALALALVSLSATGFLMLRWLRPPEGQGPNEPGGVHAAAPSAVPANNAALRVPFSYGQLFKQWPQDRKPSLVFLLSAEMHGYNHPCGCSYPQYGGVERRYNFMQRLQKERGWTIVPLDLGDVAQKSGPQTRIKYVTSMKVLTRLGYRAMGVGQNEFAQSLQDLLAMYVLNEPEAPKVLAANLQDLANTFFGCVHPSHALTENGVRVGVVGVVGPSVAREVRDPVVKFNATEATLPGALKELADNHRPELLALLYQGTVEEAKACASRFPQFAFILCLSREEDASERPLRVGNTLVISVGHKGRDIGMLGVYRTGKSTQPFELHYQLARIGPEYETPPGQDQANPVLGLLEEYAREVKNQNYLAHYIKTRHPIQLEPAFANSTYVGSEKCKSCHPASYQVWKDSPHSGAYQKLVEAKRPSLRQFDGECIGCHTVGFDYQSGFRNEAETPKLRDNGCENCHGPASLHVKNPNNAQLNALMNPFKTQPNETPEARNQRMQRLDLSCQKCHDSDNDVNWNIKKWDRIVHREPRD